MVVSFGDVGVDFLGPATQHGGGIGLIHILQKLYGTQNSHLRNKSSDEGDLLS